MNAPTNIAGGPIQDEEAAKRSRLAGAGMKIKGMFSGIGHPNKESAESNTVDHPAGVLTKHEYEDAKEEPHHDRGGTLFGTGNVQGDLLQERVGPDTPPPTPTVFATKGTPPTGSPSGTFPEGGVGIAGTKPPVTDVGIKDAATIKDTSADNIGATVNKAQEAMQAAHASAAATVGEAAASAQDVAQQAYSSTADNAKIAADKAQDAAAAAYGCTADTVSATGAKVQETARSAYGSVSDAVTTKFGTSTNTAVSQAPLSSPYGEALMPITGDDKSANHGILKGAQESVAAAAAAVSNRVREVAARVGEHPTVQRAGDATQRAAAAARGHPAVQRAVEVASAGYQAAGQKLQESGLPQAVAERASELSAQTRDAAAAAQQHAADYVAKTRDAAVDYVAQAHDQVRNTRPEDVNRNKFARVVGALGLVWLLCLALGLPLKITIALAAVATAAAFIMESAAASRQTGSRRINLSVPTGQPGTGPGAGASAEQLHTEFGTVRIAPEDASAARKGRDAL